jgi:hypothetical protein
MSPGVPRPRRPDYLGDVCRAFTAYIRWHKKMAKIDPGFDFERIAREQRAADVEAAYQRQFEADWGPALLKVYGVSITDAQKSN